MFEVTYSLPPSRIRGRSANLYPFFVISLPLKFFIPPAGSNCKQFFRKIRSVSVDFRSAVGRRRSPRIRGELRTETGRIRGRQSRASS